MILVSGTSDPGSIPGEALTPTAFCGNIGSAERRTETRSDQTDESNSNGFAPPFFLAHTRGSTGSTGSRRASGSAKTKAFVSFVFVCEMWRIERKIGSLARGERRASDSSFRKSGSTERTRFFEKFDLRRVRSWSLCILFLKSDFRGRRRRCRQLSTTQTNRPERQRR